jgi:2-phosphosulfolactate phosphatase
VARDSDIAIVVDILSFTTTLSVALDAGTVVLPYRWNDESAALYAREHDAVLAVNRASTNPGGISLSARSIRHASPISWLVLPSPNGSAISHHLASTASTVLGASLRNASAVARWITDNHDAAATTVAVIAAGERWPDRTLRLAIEDLWGAGAVLSHLYHSGWTDVSPEAEVARHSYERVAGGILEQLCACASGRELIGKGFPDDVEIAAELDQSQSVPILREHQFIRA